MTLDLATFWTTTPNADRPYENAPWMKGAKITWEEIWQGLGSVEHCTLQQLLSGKTEKVQGETFRFGKYKGRLLADVAEEDPGYLRWACEEIPAVRSMATKLGLLDDDSA